MSTAHTLTINHLGSDVDITINIPTSTEFQAIAEHANLTVVILNYFWNGKKGYVVALYERNGKFLGRRKIEGDNAKTETIAVAAKLLSDFYVPDCTV